MTTETRRKETRVCLFCRGRTERRRRIRGASVLACATCVPDAPNKFNARHTIIDGIRFDSKREADTYVKLKALEASGDITELERQVKFDLHGAGGGLIGRYTVDFRYWENGRRIACEVKGYKTRDYVLRKKLFLDEYGESHDHIEV
jgi:hypothetical protein